jgi:O-antigen/teichoic acid export membrane protein
MVAAVVFVAGMAMLACAILIPRSIVGGIAAVSVLGYLVMFSAALMWCKAPLRRPRRSRLRRDGLGSGP